MKCRDCKWLCGEEMPTAHIGTRVECMQPEKQARWAEERASWMGEYRGRSARFKNPSGNACSRFVLKGRE